MNTDNRLLRVIVTESSSPYVPLNVECVGLVDNRGRLLSCHRFDNGAGTYLSGSERIKYHIARDASNSTWNLS